MHIIQQKNGSETWTIKIISITDDRKCRNSYWIMMEGILSQIGGVW